MKVGIATDHNGVEEKKKLIEYLTKEGYEVFDYSQDNTPTDDYPDFAKRVADAINKKDIHLGILMCGTGIGMSIAANKISGIRAAKCSNKDEARLARFHNNANILCMSYKESLRNLKIMSKTFLITKFSNEERHIRRIKKIGKLK